MDLRHLVAMIRASAAAIVVLAVLGLVAGLAATLLSEPVYRAQTTVMVSVVTGESPNDLNLGATFVSRQIATYAELARSPRVLEPVVEKLGLPVSGDGLRGDVSASAQANTALIDIFVTRNDAQQAAAIANEVTEELARAVAATSPGPTGGPSNISVTAIAPAVAPSTPFAPSPTTNLGIGLFVGLLLGLGWAVLRHSLDTQVRTENDVRDLTHAPVLGTISYALSGRRSQRPLVAPVSSQRAEEFRQLRTSLQFVGGSEPPRSFVVTSARRGEGRTSTAVNLAVALARSGTAVCLVDADLRNPMVAPVLGIDAEHGLASVLAGDVELDDVLTRYEEDGPHVVGGGRTLHNPSELLSTSAMERVIGELEKRFEVVIFDCAPLLPVADAAILSKLTGGALAVVGSASVTREELSEALTKLATIDGRLLGLVVNRLKDRKVSTPAYG
jgi:capsular exopolysaccharide synthesis family protein